jgi:hypothetical protein
VVQRRRRAGRLRELAAALGAPNPPLVEGEVALVGRIESKGTQRDVVTIANRQRRERVSVRPPTFRRGETSREFDSEPFAIILDSGIHVVVHASPNVRLEASSKRAGKPIPWNGSPRCVSCWQAGAREGCLVLRTPESYRGIDSEFALGASATTPLTITTETAGREIERTVRSDWRAFFGKLPIFLLFAGLTKGSVTILGPIGLNDFRWSTSKETAEGILTMLVRYPRLDECSFRVSRNLCDDARPYARHRGHAVPGDPESG